jgi:hypothetical protein
MSLTRAENIQSSLPLAISRSTQSNHGGHIATLAEWNTAAKIDARKARLLSQIVRCDTSLRALIHSEGCVATFAERTACPMVAHPPKTCVRHKVPIRSFSDQRLAPFRGEEYLKPGASGVARPASARRRKRVIDTVRPIELTRRRHPATARYSEL